MEPDRRRAAATSLVGAGLVGTSGLMREDAVRRATKLTGKPRRRPPSLALLAAPLSAPRQRARKLWLAGTALGAVGSVGMGTGLHQLVHPEKVKKRRGFVTEGVLGTADAVKQRGENLREKAPLGARALPWATGAAVGTGASLAAHRALDRLPRAAKGRSAIVPVVGTLAATSALPIGRKMVADRYPGFEVTPAGVRRAKHAPVKASRKASVHDQKTMGRSAFRRATVPSDRRVRKALERDYPGKSYSPRQKRAMVYAAGGTPVVGSVLAARTAARLAPPEQRREAALTQYASATGGKWAGAAAGAYGTAALARRSQTVNRRATEAHNQVERVKTSAVNQARSAIGLKPASGPKKAPRIDRATARAQRMGLKRTAQAVTAVTKPLKGVGGPAALGAAVGGAIAGNVAGYHGYSRVLERERARNARIGKSMPAPGLNQADRRKLARKKRVAAASSTFTGLTGLGALVALGAKKPKIQTGLLTAGAAVGGANSLNFAGVLRREAEAERAKIKKASSKRIITSMENLPSMRVALRRSKPHRIHLPHGHGVMVPKGSKVEQTAMVPASSVNNPIKMRAVRADDVELPRSGGVMRAKRGHLVPIGQRAFEDPTDKMRGTVRRGRIDKVAPHYLVTLKNGKTIRRFGPDNVLATDAWLKSPSNPVGAPHRAHRNPKATQARAKRAQAEFQQAVKEGRIIKMSPVGADLSVARGILVPMTRAKSYRASHIRVRRTAPGRIVQTRVRAGVG